MPLLELKNLVVQFGGLTAVGGVDCQVQPGDIFSIIGPNGAGKTTVFNAITGIYDPTAGHVELAGSRLRRPLTWKVMLACLLIGLATGAAAMLAASNVDKFWRAAIKRNYDCEAQTFSYADAWRSTGEYLRGELALQSQRGHTWSVTTADGVRTLGYAPTRQGAEQLRDQLTEIVDLQGSEATLVERGGNWQVRSADLERTLATFDSREAAESRLERLAAIGRDQQSRGRNVWIVLVFGFLIGSSGSFAVWNRSRRTPDVIARGGVARTFQNIRLFQNMTVAENVLIGLDRRFCPALWQIALRTPGAKRKEALAWEQAMQLLDFVGLSAQRNMLAKNLPYGDQRRLEIARALATEPRLILLDEPAAGMNPKESGDLQVLIGLIRDRGVTVLLIEHHMKVVMGISNRIAVLDYGLKIAEGTPEQVRNNPDVIRAYLGSEEVG